MHHWLTEQVIRVSYQVCNELGFGFAESIYKEAMRHALLDVGIGVEPEVNLQVHFRGRLIGMFRADLVVASKVILELKIADRITKTQKLTYALLAVHINRGWFGFEFRRSPDSKAGRDDK